MRAVVARSGTLHIETVDDRTPSTGQVLVRSLTNGICGSDLHVLHVQRADPEVLPAMILGHEFCAEILDHGPATSRRLPAGTLVCSVPFVDGPRGPELVGLSPNFRSLGIGRRWPGQMAATAVATARAFPAWACIASMPIVASSVFRAHIGLPTDIGFESIWTHYPC